MGSAIGCRIHLPQGDILGTERDGVQRYLGIPYAEPPTGPLRFRAPVALTVPRPDHDGRAFGPACPQHLGPAAVPARVAPPGFDEDCLRLNIWAKRPDGRARPVLVWIHGGAFLGGSSNMYGGQHFAADHDIVVVTLNYRLGVLGFVDFGSVTGDETFSTNLGLRDQIAALRWIRDNIEAFGGDPARVTIAGESAGSMSVSLLMVSPEAPGLFHGAILQSGALSLIFEREVAARVASHYRDVLGLGADAARQLRSMPVRALLRAQIEVSRRLRGTVAAQPWYDGALLPSSLEAARSAPASGVPLLAGFTREEIRFFDALPGPRILPSRMRDLRELAEAQLGREHAEQLDAAYAGGREAERAYASHATFGMPTLHFAERHSERHPTWFYRFDMAHPLIGAAHGQDVFYVWNMRGPAAAIARGGPLTGPRRALAQRMRRHWSHFVRHGDPGPDWPRFDRAERRTRLYDVDDRIVDDPDRSVRRAWQGADIGPGISPRTR